MYLLSFCQNNLRQVIGRDHSLLPAGDHHRLVAVAVQPDQRHAGMLLEKPQRQGRLRRGRVVQNYIGAKTSEVL